MLILCGASVLASQESSAEQPSSPFYLHSDIGATYMQNLKGPGGFAGLSMNAGARGDIALGYSINECFAAEFETGAIWNSSEGNLIDIYQIPILLNGIWNIHTHSAWTPYIGAGVGGVATHFVDRLGSDTDFTFAYQGMVGIKYAMCPRSELDLSYKFLGSLDHEFSVGPFTDKFDGFMTHAVLLSFIVKF
jgi:opacity protein-like surface antigen